MNLALGLLIGAGVVIAVGLAAGAFIDAGDVDPPDGDEFETGGGDPQSSCPAACRSHSPSEVRSRNAHPSGKWGGADPERTSTHVLLDTIPTNGDRFVGLCACGVLSLPVSSRESCAAWHLTHVQIERSIDTFAPGGER